MIHLTPEGAATALASLVLIAAFALARARSTRNARILAKYRRGEQDREVKRRVADILEDCNVNARRAR